MIDSPQKFKYKPRFKVYPDGYRWTAAAFARALTENDIIASIWTQEAFEEDWRPLARWVDQNRLSFHRFVGGVFRDLDFSTRKLFLPIAEGLPKVVMEAIDLGSGTLRAAAVQIMRGRKFKAPANEELDFMFNHDFSGCRFERCTFVHPRFLYDFEDASFVDCVFLNPAFHSDFAGTYFDNCEIVHATSKGNRIEGRTILDRVILEGSNLLEVPGLNPMWSSGPYMPYFGPRPFKDKLAGQAIKAWMKDEGIKTEKKAHAFLETIGEFVHGEFVHGCKDKNEQYSLCAYLLKQKHDIDADDRRFFEAVFDRADIELPEDPEERRQALTVDLMDWLSKIRE